MKHYKRSRGFCNCLFVILIINAIQYSIHSTAKWSSMPIHCIHVKANHKTLFSKICQVHLYSISLNLRQFCSLNTKLVSNGHPHCRIFHKNYSWQHDHTFFVIFRAAKAPEESLIFDLKASRCYCHIFLMLYMNKLSCSSQNFFKNIVQCFLAILLICFFCFKIYV